MALASPDFFKRSTEKGAALGTTVALAVDLHKIPVFLAVATALFLAVAIYMFQVPALPAPSQILTHHAAFLHAFPRSLAFSKRSWS